VRARACARGKRGRPTDRRSLCPARTQGASAQSAHEAAGARAEPHLVISSFDGFVHVVHARTGCRRKVDVGEHAYAQVLA
jgi:hypothetical protein